VHATQVPESEKNKKFVIVGYKSMSKQNPLAVGSQFQIQFWFRIGLKLNLIKNVKRGES